MSSVLSRISTRYGTVGAGVYAGVLSLVVLAIIGIVGLLTKLPWLFPSLGPTVMLFFESPTERSSRPVNTLVGHGVGIVVGIGCLAAFGLFGRPAATVAGLTLAYLLAGAVSVAVTTLVLTSIRLPHPPAGASTLIVSLGIISTAPKLLTMAAAIVLVVIVGWGLNILLGTRPKAQEPAKP
jgi:hypothetical protein